MENYSAVLEKEDDGYRLLCRKDCELYMLTMHLQNMVELKQQLEAAILDTALGESF